MPSSRMTVHILSQVVSSMPLKVCLLMPSQAKLHKLILNIVRAACREMLPMARAWFPGTVHSCTGRVVSSEPIFHSGRAHSLAAWHGFPWTSPVLGGAGIGFSTARQGFAVVGGQPWFFSRQALFSVAQAERARRGWAWFAATQAQFTGGPGKVFHCPACI